MWVLEESVMHAELVIEFEKPTGGTDCPLGPSQEGHPAIILSESTRL